VLEICINRACADQLESLLSFGVSDLLTKGLPALQKIFTNGASAIVAGVQSLGGWVALCIAVSCAYWAALIHLNKTPKGICLYIPLPWTFGLIGPGWAIGTR
jgi:hypothetical protein